MVLAPWTRSQIPRKYCRSSEWFDARRRFELSVTFFFFSVSCCTKFIFPYVFHGASIRGVCNLEFGLWFHTPKCHWEWSMINYGYRSMIFNDHLSLRIGPHWSLIIDLQSWGAWQHEHFAVPSILGILCHTLPKPKASRLLCKLPAQVDKNLVHRWWTFQSAQNCSEIHNGQVWDSHPPQNRQTLKLETSK